MRNAIDEPEGSRYFNGEFRRAIKVSIPKTHISAKPRRERKRGGEETAQLTTKSGHPLKFTSSWRARILLSNGTPHSSLLRVNLRVEIRSIDRSESRTRVFPDLRIQPAARVPRRGIRGEVDSRMDQSGDRVEKRTPPPFKRRWTTMIARILSLLSCSYFLGVTCSGCSRSPIGYRVRSERTTLSLPYRRREMSCRSLGYIIKTRGYARFHSRERYRAVREKCDSCDNPLVRNERRMQIRRRCSSTSRDAERLD